LKDTDPVHLLVSYNDSDIPTQNKADFRGIHLWDDGQGIFIEKS
jgi:hypothetical protein